MLHVLRGIFYFSGGIFVLNLNTNKKKKKDRIKEIPQG